MALTRQQRLAARKGKPKTGRDSEFQQKKNANPEYIFETNRRGRKVKKKNPKYIPPTRKPDGSKLEPTTSGSKESQAQAQQKVIASKEYQDGLKKMQTKWKKQATAKVSDYMDKPKTDPYSTTALADKAAKTKLKSKNKVVRDVKGREVETYYEDGKYKWRPKSQEKLKINGNKGSKKPESTPTNVFTKHYKTGKDLGVMSRSARRAYEKEAGTKTWESEKKRLGAKGNKQNTKASSKSWRKKQELKLAKKDPTSMKAGKNKAEEERKRRVGFNSNSNKPEI